MTMDIPYNTKCDCCDEKATHVLSSKDCVWIVEWFVGWYCKRCRAAVIYYARENSLSEGYNPYDQY